MKIKTECRYEENLNYALKSLGGIKKILRLDFDSDYQGYIDCDVLLKNDKIFSYKYEYGSCSACDDWEHRELSDEEISSEMIKEATIFDNLKEYNVWVIAKGGINE